MSPQSDNARAVQAALRELSADVGQLKGKLRRAGDLERARELARLCYELRVEANLYPRPKSDNANREDLTMNTDLVAHPKPDDGLPIDFLNAVADELNRERPELEATVEYPGVLDITVEGMSESRLHTGLTGLHIHDDDGWSPDLEVDLIALEKRDTLTVREYVDTLLHVVDDSEGIVR